MRPAPLLSRARLPLLSGQRVRLRAATFLLLLGLLMPRPGHAQSGAMAVNPGSGPANNDSARAPGWQTLTFVESGLQVLSGNLELLLATWTAHCQNFQKQALHAVNISGVTFQRQLHLDGQNGKLHSRILAYGPVWQPTNEATNFSLQESEAPNAPLCSIVNPMSLSDRSHGVPDRFTWWGRLTVPIVWAGGQAEQSQFLEQVLAAADRFHWVVETQQPNGDWMPVILDSDVLERSFQNDWRTHEDWYFNPQQFSLHARVLALHWQDADGRQFRYRLREG